MKEVYPLTLKGFTQTCLGDAFEDQGLVDKLADAYNKCWREMEVCMMICISFLPQPKVIQN